MKDLGHLRYCLGIEIARSEKGIFLSQRKYVLDLLHEAGMRNCKPLKLPLTPNLKLLSDTGKYMKNPKQYRRLIGQLIYLTTTRPDLSYSVQLLSQFMHKPTEEHTKEAMHILRYLKRAPRQGVLLSKTSSTQLNAYCDSDWGSCPISRKSTTGYGILLGKSPISYRVKKQGVVARSSAEAEYRAIVETCCEVTWLLSLLKDLTIDHLEPVNLYCDSQAALHIMANPVFHERTKHIELDLSLIHI